MGYVTWILALLGLTAAVVIGLVILYLVVSGITNLMTLRTRRRTLVLHG